VFGKVKKIFIELYKYCMLHKVLTWKNSGFKLLDSTIFQLISLIHNMYKNLDSGKSITIIYLDISKAFDRVWHEGLIFKLQTIGVCGSLLQWLKSYLSHRRQKVVIKGNSSSWFNTNAGVPQGSILGPLLFLIFINDIIENIQCDIRLFADDTCLFDINENVDQSISNLNKDIITIIEWANKWCVSFNPSKTVVMNISYKKPMLPQSPLYFKGQVLNFVDNHKHLGIVLNNKLSWENHISYVIEKVANRINLIRKIQYRVPRKCLENIYKTMILPIIDYGDVLYPVLPKCINQRIEFVQRQAALICTKAYLRIYARDHAPFP
jgi:hypothetical protein